MTRLVFLTTLALAMSPALGAQAALRIGSTSVAASSSTKVVWL